MLTEPVLVQIVRIFHKKHLVGIDFVLALGLEADRHCVALSFFLKYRHHLATAYHKGEITREQVLESLTAIRRQTAIDVRTGAPLRETLRFMRVILRQTQFEAELYFASPPSDAAKGLLAACVKALQRAGTGRNRGRGELEARLYDVNGAEQTEAYFQFFKEGI